MRPERLTISAFGPFAGTAVIDFTLLGSDGLYLVSGDTGSGKTTIFDALCYALYGVTTSQNERSAESMRSHYAPPDVKTRVELVFLEKGERYRVERAPAQSRPKKRGEGEVEEGASVTLTLPDNSVITRKKDADEKIVSLIGMNGEQFSQIVMLPQGKFSKFLSSKTEEKQKLFKTLFSTENYSRLQLELSERAKEARDEARLAELGQKNIVTPLSLPKESALYEKLEDAKKAQYLPPDTRALLEEALAELAASFREAEKRSSSLSAAIKELETKIEKAEEKRTKLASLESKRKELVEASKEVLEAEDVNKLSGEREKEKTENIAEITKLESLLPQYKDRDSQKAELSKKREELRLERQTLSAIEEVIREKSKTLEETKDALNALKDIQSRVDAQSRKERELSERLISLSSAVSKAEERDETLREAQKTEALLKEREKEIGERTENGKTLKEKEREIKASLEALGDLPSREAQVKGYEETVLKLKAAGEKISSKKEDIMKIETSLVALNEDYMRKARKHALMMSAFYAEAAASLAKELKEGEPCPVCGSLSHPSPMTGGEESCTQAECNEAEESKNSAFSLVKDSENKISAAKAELNILKERFKELRNSLPESLRGEKERDMEALVQKEREALEADLEKKDRLENRLQSVQNDIKENDEELNQVLRERAGSEASFKNLKERYRKLSGEAEEKAVAAGARPEGLEEAFRVARKEREEAKSFLDKLNRERERADKLKADYDSLYDGINKLNTEKTQTEGTIHTIEALLAAKEETLAKLEKTLGGKKEAEVRELIESLKEKNRMIETENEEAAKRLNKAKEIRSALLGSAAELESQIASIPDYDEKALLEESASLEEKLKEADKKKSELQVARANFSSALKKYTESEKEGEELLEKRRLLDELDAVASGRLSGENKLSLETYIQTRYLDRILLRANRILLSLSEGQYEMERSAEARSGRAKMGLDIDVMDHFTGKSRPASTLSGGETFEASLALALGLSEEIQASAGAVRIETMFVDEGFGSLDDESLSSAVETLSSLAVGGRLVGVISHVEALKNSIDRQIIVTKNPNRGSGIEIKA